VPRRDLLRANPSLAAEVAGPGHPVTCAVEQPLFRAPSIFGGTTEIQKEIIARSLGL